MKHPAVLLQRKILDKKREEKSIIPPTPKQLRDREKWATYKLQPGVLEKVRSRSNMYYLRRREKEKFILENPEEMEKLRKEIMQNEFNTPRK